MSSVKSHASPAPVQNKEVAIYLGWIFGYRGEGWLGYGAGIEGIGEAFPTL